jgi:hypothetical protein
MCCETALKNNISPIYLHALLGVGNFVKCGPLLPNFLKTLPILNITLP